jgi:hypothetical protein
MTFSEYQAANDPNERPLFYKLKHKKLVPVEFEEYVIAFSNWEARRIRVFYKGDMKLSTVFLGIDNAIEGPPVVFETMLFDKGKTVEVVRTSTHWEALQAHRTLKEKL